MRIGLRVLRRLNRRMGVRMVRRRSCEGLFVGVLIALGMELAFYRALTGIFWVGIVQARPLGMAKDWMADCIANCVLHT